MSKLHQFNKSAGLAVCLLSSASILTFANTALAADVTLSSGTTTTTQSITDGSTLTVNNSATLQTAGDAVEDAVNGTSIIVKNDGTIRSTAGTAINTDGSNLTLSNSGTINGNQFGIFGNVLNDLMNSGAITGVNSGVTYATITALTNTSSGAISATNGNAINAIDIGALTNSGFITATNGDGINSANDLTSLVNTGTISGSIDGVFVTSAVGSITNHGTISGGNNGVDVGEITTLINTGTIIGVGNDAVRADCGCGIGNLVNSGIITGGDEGVDTEALGTLTNSGSITGADKGIDADFGTVTNSGSIVGNVGIQFDRDSVGNALITNSGTIASSAGPSGDAIQFQGAGSDSLTLNNGSILVGRILWDGMTDTLNLSTGESASITFDNLPQTINFSTQLTGTSGTTVVQADPTAIGVMDDIFLYFIHDVDRVVFDRLNSHPNNNTNGQAGYGYNSVPDETGRSSWASAWGGVHQVDATSSSPLAVAGSTVGSDYFFDDGKVAGFYAGLGASHVKTGTSPGHNIHNTAIYGGIYGRTYIEDVIADISVQAGSLRFDSRRNIANNLVAGGIETAVAQFGGYYFAPSIKFSKEIPSAADYTVTPALSFGYNSAFIDQYSEAGTTSNMSVASRKIHSVTARGEIAFGRKTADGKGKVSTYLGLEGYHSWGDVTNATVTFLGNTSTVNVGGRTSGVRAFGGINFDQKISERTKLRGSLELKVADNGNIGADANLRFGLKF